MPITVKRLSDGKVIRLDDVTPDTRVGHLKKELAKHHLDPKFKNGCRLMTHNGKVMKSIHRLKHYQVAENETINMDDTKNWSSSSSSSDSTD